MSISGVFFETCATILLKMSMEVSVVTERQQEILKLLEGRQGISIRELASALYISEASIRRDVELLKKAGALRRVHGGVLPVHCNSVVPLMIRDGEHSCQKESVARQAAQLVPDGATIMLDASSTVRRMLKYLAHRRGLTIITNNMRVFDELGACDAEVYCTGGRYNRENHAFVGPAAESFLHKIRADMLFFSSQGVSMEGEISDNSEPETSLRRAMLDSAGQKIFLMDSSKLGIQCTFHLCGREIIDKFVCDVQLPWMI